MKNIKKHGKRLLAMVLSLVMCFGLLQTTALAASWNPGDKITINVRVFDQNTRKTYDVGTDYVTKGDQYIQSVTYQIPQLTKFVKADQFGRVIKVAGNWYFPSGDSQPGANVEWSCNVSKVTMTYWVNSFSTGSGTGGNTSDTIDLGGSGRNTINFTIRYHSNYPAGTNYTATKKYTVKSYATIYNVFSSQFLTYTACGFGGFTPKASEKTWYTTAACTTVAGTIGATNGGVYDLYAGWESVPEPVQTLTLTYKDGATVYRTISGFSSGDDTLLLDCSIEKTGYKFEGWSKTSGSATAEYKAGEVFTITQNTTLYAVWTPVEVTPATTTLTVSKVLNGIEASQLPDNFSVNATVINGSSFQAVTLNKNKLEDTVTISTSTATTVVISESNYAVDHYDCTVTDGTGAAVTGNAMYMLEAGTLDPACPIINTYVSNVEPNKQLTGITKERLTVVPAGLGLSGINTADPVTLKVGETVTLLYAITVSGNEGANYKVTDNDAQWVGGASLNGTIGSSETATIYVTKQISIADIVEGYVENTAYAEPGDGTDVGATEPIASVRTRVNGELVVTKTDEKINSETTQYTVSISNQTGRTKRYLVLTDSMDLGLTPITDDASWYTLTLRDKDGNVYEPVSCIVDVDGRTLTWDIDTTFETGAELVLVYRVEVGSGEDDESATNHIHVDTWNALTPARQATSDGLEDEVVSGDASCTIYFGQYSN